MASVLFNPEYVDRLEGDHLAALMLSQIVYWSSLSKTGKTKLRVLKNGRYWLVKSHQDWWQELRLTQKQSRRCIEVLRERGLIKTEIHKFNSAPTVHILLVTDAPKGKSEMPFGAHPNCPQGHIPIALQGTSLTETTAETTTETTLLDGVSPLKTAEELQAEAQEKTMDAKQILAQFKDKQPAATGPAGLGLLWRKEVGGMEDKFVPQLTLKEIGQLKHVMAQLGQGSGAVVRYVVRNWTTFSQQAAIEKAVQPASKPHVGFFCAHFAVAAQLIADQAKTSSVAVTTQPMPKVIAPPKLKPDNEDIASEADIAETMAKLNAILGGP